MNSTDIPKTKTNRPLIQVVVGVSTPRFAALTAAGQPVPPSVTATFMVDTGVKSTVINPELIARLSIPPSGLVPVSTTSAESDPLHGNTYDVMLFVPRPNNTMGIYIDAMPVAESGMQERGIDGLLGRDIFECCTLIYKGPGNRPAVAF